jgi:hypothetical protein
VRAIAFTILALISLIISVTAAGMWLRRTQLSDQFNWTRSNGPASGRPAAIHYWILEFAAGIVRFDRCAQEVNDPAQPFWEMSRNYRFHHEVGTPWSTLPLMPPGVYRTPPAESMSTGVVLAWQHFTGAT